MPRNETPAEKVRREQRELIARLNAERDKKIPVREQNQMRMRGATPTTGRTQQAATPQGTGPRSVPLGGAAGRAQAALATRGRQIDEAVDKASKGKDPNQRNGGGSRGRR